MRTKHDSSINRLGLLVVAGLLLIAVLSYTFLSKENKKQITGDLDANIENIGDELTKNSLVASSQVSGLIVEIQENKTSDKTQKWIKLAVPSPEFPEGKIPDKEYKKNITIPANTTEYGFFVDKQTRGYERVKVGTRVLITYQGAELKAQNYLPVNVVETLP